MYDAPSEVPKGEVWFLLGDKAIPFALWLNKSDNPNSVAVKTIFDSLININLSSEVFYGILQILLAENIITQVEVDACAKRAAELNIPPSFGDTPEDTSQGTVVNPLP